MKTTEYAEGPEALENFKQFGRMILQAPANKKKQPKKAASTRKPKKSDRD